MIINTLEIFVTTCKRKFCLYYNKNLADSGDKITTNDIKINWMNDGVVIISGELTTKFNDENFRARYLYNKETGILKEIFLSRIGVNIYK